MVALQKPGGDAFSPVAYYPGAPQGGLKLAEVTERALREGQGVVLQAGERHQLAHPVRVEGELRGVVALELEARGEGGARAAMRELQ